VLFGVVGAILGVLFLVMVLGLVATGLQKAARLKSARPEVMPHQGPDERRLQQEASDSALGESFLHPPPDGL
jgi:hypothetical protein